MNIGHYTSKQFVCTPSGLRCSLERCEASPLPCPHPSTGFRRVKNIWIMSCILHGFIPIIGNTPARYTDKIRLSGAYPYMLHRQNTVIGNILLHTTRTKYDCRERLLHAARTKYDRREHTSVRNTDRLRSSDGNSKRQNSLLLDTLKKIRFFFV
jgi:hypothetical protein